MKIFMAKHIPNILTVARFILIPFIIYYIATDRFILALIFLIISGLTDVLDGWIARKFNFITNFGKLIDPLADKATQIAVLLCLAFKEIIPYWIIIVVALKEAAMIAGASFLYGKQLVVSSRWFGKLATVLFYIAIACSFGIRYWNNIASDPVNSVAPLPSFDLWIYYLALAATIFSLVMYYVTFYKQGYLKKENMKIQDKEKNNEDSQI